MTRINCLSPNNLIDKHLVAEYYELPRVFGLVRKAIARGETAEFYARRFRDYTFGTGHVKFFYTRLAFLGARYALLVEEMLKRKMRPNPVPIAELFTGIGPEWVGDWVPTEADKALNLSRLAERLAEMDEKAKNKVKRPVITPYNEKEILGTE